MELRKNSSKKSAIVLIGIALSLGIILFFLETRHAALWGISDSGKYVGSKVCASCHQKQWQLWIGSHHEQSMQRAVESSVLGDFNIVQYTAFGSTSTFSKKGSDYFVSTDGPEGTLRDFKIAYTFGVYPLQQYLVAFPGGRLQVLPLAWDSRSGEQGGQRWFHLYPDEQITSKDELHWTGPNQTWNYMCAECHSTNLKKNYNMQSDRYDTEFSELNVACEACHGAGARHAAWAAKTEGQKDYDDKRLDVYFNQHNISQWVVNAVSGNAVRNGSQKVSTEVEACARCHSHRTPVFDKYSPPANPILDTHSVSLLNPDLYFVDGQVKGEVFEYGSFLQSKMYASGVTCSDCHEPHSLKLRTEGNGVCLQCHSADKYNRKEHNFHKGSTTESSGTKCIDCHMPTTTFMVVDERHDHSFRIPRPDLSLDMGTPNPCNQCHQGKTAQWALSTMEGWYGTGFKSRPNYTYALRANDAGGPGAEKTYLAMINNPLLPPIVRATAISHLPSPFSPMGVATLNTALTEPSGLIRAAAARAIGSVEPVLRLKMGAALLKDPIRTVRIEAAFALSNLPSEILSKPQKLDLENAMREFVDSQIINGERPESHLNLGLFYERTGQITNAELAYLKSIRQQRMFVPAYINLADLYRRLGRENEGEELLRNAVTIIPNSAWLHHSLGLTLVRTRSAENALPHLAKAVDINQESLTYGYTYAIALHSANRVDEAIEVLVKVNERHPANREVLTALSSFNYERGEIKIAAKYAMELLKNYPEDMSTKAFLKKLEKLLPKS